MNPLVQPAIGADVDASHNRRRASPSGDRRIGFDGELAGDKG
ncbi:MAG: hypothetical protein ABSH42_18860 [Bryobacteraceae bacterium]